MGEEGGEWAMEGSVSPVVHCHADRHLPAVDHGSHGGNRAGHRRSIDVLCGHPSSR